jgi:trk system potassium uptake protein
VRIVIIGAGKVGTFIAGDLIENGHEVVVVERDAQQVERRRSTDGLESVEWVVADACEVGELSRANLERADVVLAVTGDDEDNLVTSLLAKQEFGVPRVMARVNHPANEWMFTEMWGVDIAVSAPHLLSALVEEAVSVGSIVRLLQVAGGKARLVEVTLSADSPILGRTIVAAGFPRGSSVVAIVRSGDVVVPRGDTSFHLGDEVMVLVSDSPRPKCRRCSFARDLSGDQRVCRVEHHELTSFAPGDPFEQDGTSGLDPEDSRPTGEHGHRRAGAVMDGDAQTRKAARRRSLLAAYLAPETGGLTLLHLADRAHLDTVKTALESSGIQLGNRTDQALLQLGLGGHLANCTAGEATTSRATPMTTWNPVLAATWWRG